MSAMVVTSLFPLLQLDKRLPKHHRKALLPMASPGKFSFSFSKFPEGGLILAIIVLGLLLSVFGGSVQRPKFQKVEGKQVRVFETGPNGQKVPGFVTVNKFFNAQTLIQIAKDTSFFAIMAVGMTIVIITGGIDLSVGSTYALASVCGALFLAQYGASGGLGPVLVGILITIGVGVLAGLLNGAMIVAFNVHPFIITLGTMAIYRGIAFVQTGGQSIGGFPEQFRSFVRQEFNGLSLVPLIVMIIVMIIGGIFLATMAIGRKIYAIGGNETASRYSGIRVGAVKALVYAISGLTAGIAAVLSLGYYGAGSSGDGQGYELNVIAAAVVGGASLVGGKGTALGALLGAVILQMISNGLVILNIPQNYSQIVIGLVVIAAVLFDQFNAWLANRRLLAKTGRIKKEVLASSEAPVSITPQTK
jgi:ribose transport system permease protein